ncbi:MULTISPECIES: cation:proton antiporter regulatory subunit [Alkalihalophilus]|uniref:TrkA C-terminal domain-containing protein n=1 Tax=Alkalihalophilus pseudofirmus TaxID=79885 RepID=A0AAJ2NRI9_ALKPS|nr:MULTISPECIES: TrkA C-terminal domain-containing protein [Alkalihalophilus]MDV2887188.1 TrkA C-terminal domain-containing protein [Alkalihalophilus pseudofirmus]MEC2071028.1 TrkA C-terminal domain-containing protein [Alkalihalophilus marmarensis]MED1602079.1 TrkA C-terminal domain-containing protein [Alkalihalophilus marmarensis]OLS34927.1 potassium transporter TrkA [Alkalihalophilus pseudofirmus]
MKITSGDLPGVGKKISFITSEGSMVVLVIHHTGKREMYFFDDADDDEVSFSLTLSAEETKQMGAQLLGAILNPADTDKIDRIKLIRKQVVVEWIDITKHSPIISKSIAQIEKIKPKGISIVGVFKNDEMMVDPEPTLILEKGDTLMAVGKRDAIQKFEELCACKENN